MEFEWDDKKRRDNLAKHGIDFSQVLVAFIDKHKVLNEDNRRKYDEVRYNMIASVLGDIVFVTFTMRDAVVRIISARPASRKERGEYERHQSEAD